MKNITWRWIQYFLILVVCAAQIHFIQMQFSWCPIDEYAHMDYIEKLSQGRMPAVSDTIETEILNDIIMHPERNVYHRSESKSTLGLALFSYQAKHPPVYYAILAPLNKMLKKYHFPVFTRLRILRLVSFGGYVLGLLLLIPVTKKFRLAGFQVKSGWPSLGILFGLLIASHERYGLGNNMWSVLINLTSVLCVLHFLANKKLRFLWMAFFLLGISLLTALTNIFVLPILIFLIVFLIRKHPFTVNHYFFLSTSLILPILVFMYWQFATRPSPSYNGWIEEILRIGILSGAVEYSTFLNFLFRDIWTMDFISPGCYNPWLVGSFLIAIFFSTTWKRFDRPKTWMISFSLAVYLLTLLFILNRFVDSVTWVAFRHYIGLIPVFYFLISPGIRFSDQNTPECAP